MADAVNDLLLWGDDFEVILDILEGDETVEQQFEAATNNVSSNCANSRFEFIVTDPKRSLAYVFVVWQVTRVTRVYKTQTFNLNMRVLPATTDQSFYRS